MTVVKIVSGREVLIDRVDEPFFDEHPYWYIRKTTSGKDYLQMSYRPRSGDAGPRRYFIFHRHVMGCVPKDGKICDHISGSTLDNRRENLRVVDAKANTHNSVGYGKGSRFKGVHWYKNRFRAKIYTPEKRQKYLGGWRNEIEAAFHYDMASLQYQEEYGRRNFLPLVR